MSQIDWIVLSITMISIVGYGIWKTSGAKNIQAYLLGDNEAKWWTVGLSVMATQASAITFLSTPGQAYHDGLEFLQFYLTLPLALIIICITFIPLYYRLKVYTAYEFLETRFDLKTRSITSFLFLLQRGLATGITIYAPALILSSIMGWNLNLTAVVIGIISIMYTVSGGTKAVHVTHRLQMIIILLGLFVIFFILLSSLPEEYSFKEMMALAGAQEKLQIIDTQFEWKDRYNIWTCLIAAPFLFLSYFGTDQSQVQRYISGRSISESRIGLLLNGLFKVPLQFFILLLGVLVFVFFQYNKAPIFFNEKSVEKVVESSYQPEYEEIYNAYSENFDQKQETQRAFIQAYRDGNTEEKQLYKTQLNQLQSDEKALRLEFKDLMEKADVKEEKNDKDYVFLNFILNHLPQGLIGLLLAMIFFAAMSSTSSELNALASTSTVDIYRRLIKKEASDRHYVNASRLLTLFWGLIAISFAAIGTLFENLIQFVNIVGSIFYGTILGIFLVAFYAKYIKGNAVFIAAVITQIFILVIYKIDIIGYLWLNLLGVLGVMSLGYLFQYIINRKHSM